MSVVIVDDDSDVSTQEQSIKENQKEEPRIQEQKSLQVSEKMFSHQKTKLISGILCGSRRADQSIHSYTQ